MALLRDHVLSALARVSGPDGAPLTATGKLSDIVADDGKGIPQEVLSKFQRGAAPGIGLAGMRERLAEFGGEIKVASSRSGSVIEATIPIKDGSTAQRRAG